MSENRPTKKKIKDAKPGDRLNDGKGLRLEVKANGGWWRFRYRYGGKEKLLSFGTYPEVSLERARQKRQEARTLVADGVDPSAKRKAERMAQADTFESIAREWFDAKCPPHKKRNGKPVVPDPDTVAQLTRRLEKYVLPYHGSQPIRDVAVPDLHQTLRRVLSAGKVETAHRIRSVTSRVFRYAVATGRAQRDPDGSGLNPALRSWLYRNWVKPSLFAAYRVY